MPKYPYLPERLHHMMRNSVYHWHRKFAEHFRSETEDWIEYAESNAMTVSFMPYQEFAAYAAEMLEDYTTYLGMIPQD